MGIILGTNGADHEKYWFICDWSNLELTYRSSLFFTIWEVQLFAPGIEKKAPTINKVKDVFEKYVLRESPGESSYLLSLFI